MREPTCPTVPITDTQQRALIERAFEAGVTAAGSLAQIVPSLDRDRTEYALAGVMLEEAWVSQRQHLWSSPSREP